MTRTGGEKKGTGNKTKCNLTKNITLDSVKTLHFVKGKKINKIQIEKDVESLVFFFFRTAVNIYKSATH